MDEQSWLWPGGQPAISTSGESPPPAAPRPSLQGEPASLSPLSCLRRSRWGQAWEGGRVSTESAENLQPASHPGCGHLFEEDGSSLETRALASKNSGSGEAVTDVLPPSVYPPVSPGSASVSSERRTTLLGPSPPARARGPRPGPGPLTFSGRKCNA